MAGLQALLFDVDGTLSDTERDGHRVAFNRAFADAGLDWHWDVETYGRLLEVSGGKERIALYINKNKLFINVKYDIKSLISQLHQAKTRHYLDLLMSGQIGLRPGVARLLRDAHGAGLRMGIATTTTRRNVTALLKATLGQGASGWFDTIVAGDAVAAKKPAPDIYHLALQQLGLRAVDCLAFEDSRNGLLAAMSAGLKTLVTVNAYTRGQNFDGAAIVLDQLGEPGAGFRVLAGDAGDSSFVDLPLLKRLHRT